MTRSGSFRATAAQRFPGAGPYRVEMASRRSDVLAMISGRPCATTARYGRLSDATDRATSGWDSRSRPVWRASLRVVSQNAPSRHRYHKGRTRGRPFASMVAKWHRRGSARNASISSGFMDIAEASLLDDRLVDEEQADLIGEVLQILGSALGSVARHVRAEVVSRVPRELGHAVVWRPLPLWNAAHQVHHIALQTWIAVAGDGRVLVQPVVPEFVGRHVILRLDPDV